MVTAAQAYWLNRKRRQARNEGARGPQIALSASSQAENTSIGTTIGNLSVVGGTGTWTFTKTVDADSAFTLTTGALKNAIVFSYETKTSYSVTIQATNGTDTITRTFTISVINVLEVTLNVLTIDDNTAVPGEAWSATITGKTSGSTITATSSDGTVLSVVGTTVSGTFAGAGTPTVTLHETHSDATPRDTGIGMMVSAVVTIDAPVSVTYIDATNPPQFNMILMWASAHPVMAGDVIKMQFDGAGPVYTSAPLSEGIDDPDFSGDPPPTLAADDYTVDFWAVRNDGEVDEVEGDHSTPEAFTVAESYIRPNVRFPGTLGMFRSADAVAADGVNVMIVQSFTVRKLAALQTLHWVGDNNGQFDLQSDNRLRFYYGLTAGDPVYKDNLNPGALALGDEINTVFLGKNTGSAYFYSFEVLLNGSTVLTNAWEGLGGSDGTSKIVLSGGSAYVGRSPYGEISQMDHHGFALWANLATAPTDTAAAIANLFDGGQLKPAADIVTAYGAPDISFLDKYAADYEAGFASFAKVGSGTFTDV